MEFNSKFFHGVSWNNEKLRLSRFESILRSGYIMPGRQMDGTKKVFLSTYPGSPLSSKYNVNKPGEDGFSISARTFYFILDPKIEDLKLVSGDYNETVTTTKKIPIRDYLVGIGNTGYEIDKDIRFAYYYQQYLNKDITEDELYHMVGRIHFPIIREESDIDDYVFFMTKVKVEGMTKFDKSLEKILSNANIVDKGYLSDIDALGKKYSCDFKYYDNFGIELNHEALLKEACKIRKYIKSS